MHGEVAAFAPGHGAVEGGVDLICGEEGGLGFAAGAGAAEVHERGVYALADGGGVAQYGADEAVLANGEG